MLALECPGDQAGKSSARAPPPAANLGRVERRRRRKWRIWQAAEEPHLHLYVADFAGDSSSCHCSVARRCLPGWPGTRDCASVATCGQGGHSGAGKGFPTHPPGGPAALPLAPTFSTRFFSAAFLSPPGGAGSGMSGSCSETPRRGLCSSIPCGQGTERGRGDRDTLLWGPPGLSPCCPSERHRPGSCSAWGVCSPQQP